MKLMAFAVRDAKAEYFNNPFFLHTAAEAERSFNQVTNDPQSKISQYPEDYDLYEVGSYDTNTGKFQTLDTPRHIVKAVQLKKN